MWIHHTLFIHVSLDGCEGCLPLLAVVSNADRKRKPLCTEREEGLCHQKRRKLDFAYGSGQSPVTSLMLCHEIFTAPELLCFRVYEEQRRSLLTRVTPLMKAHRSSPHGRTVLQNSAQWLRADLELHLPLICMTISVGKVPVQSTTSGCYI